MKGYLSIRVFSLERRDVAFFEDREQCSVGLPLGLEAKFCIYLSADRFDFLTCFVEEIT